MMAHACPHTPEIQVSRILSFACVVQYFLLFSVLVYPILTYSLTKKPEWERLNCFQDRSVDPCTKYAKLSHNTGCAGAQHWLPMKSVTWGISKKILLPEPYPNQINSLSGHWGLGFGSFPGMTTPENPCSVFTVRSSCRPNLESRRGPF